LGYKAPQKPVAFASSNVFQKPQLDIRSQLRKKVQEKTGGTEIPQLKNKTGHFRKKHKEEESGDEDEEEGRSAVKSKISMAVALV
jgi:hypothetical protein